MLHTYKKHLLIFTVALFYSAAVAQLPTSLGQVGLAQSFDVIKSQVNDIRSITSELSYSKNIQELNSSCAKLSAIINKFKKDIESTQSVLSESVKEAKKEDNDTKLKKLHEWNDALAECADQARDVEYKNEKLKTFKSFDRLAVKDLTEKMSDSINNISNELKKIN